MLSCFTKVQVKVMNSTATNATQVRLIGAAITFQAQEIVGDWLTRTAEYVNIYKTVNI